MIRPKILEGSNPVLVVLRESVWSGAGKNLLGNRRVLEQRGRAPPLKRRKCRIPLVRGNRLDVEVGIDHVFRQLLSRCDAVHLTDHVVPGASPRARCAGSIGVTVALFVLLAIPFRRGEAWAHWAVPLIGIVFTTLTAYAAYTIDVRTPAAPPWRLTLAVAATYLAGAIVSFWSWPRGGDERDKPRDGRRPNLSQRWLWL